MISHNDPGLRTFMSEGSRVFCCVSECQGLCHCYITILSCMCVCIFESCIVNILQNEGAVSVLKECVAMKPQDPIPPLLAAKVCINQLHWVRETQQAAHVHNVQIH